MTWPEGDGASAAFLSGLHRCSFEGEVPCYSEGGGPHLTHMGRYRDVRYHQLRFKLQAPPVISTDIGSEKQCYCQARMKFLTPLKEKVACYGASKISNLLAFADSAVSGLYIFSLTFGVVSVETFGSQASLAPMVEPKWGAGMRYPCALRLTVDWGRGSYYLAFSIFLGYSFPSLVTPFRVLWVERIDLPWGCFFPLSVLIDSYR